MVLIIGSAAGLAAGWISGQRNERRRRDAELARFQAVSTRRER
jgi:type II secretory pathway pseudopilin PulG